MKLIAVTVAGKRGAFAIVEMTVEEVRASDWIKEPLDDEDDKYYDRLIGAEKNRDKDGPDDTW